MPHYAVKTGRKPGIYKTWEECKAQVDGYSGAQYKKFTILDEAKKFVGDSDHASSSDSDSFELPTRKVVETRKPRLIPLTEVNKHADIVSFVDGSSVGNGTATAKAGYGVYIPAIGVKKGVRLPDGSTNNQGELLAILTALQLVNIKDKRHVIVSDSMYSIQCVTEWANTWRKRGWKKSDGGEIANLNTIKEIVKILDTSPLEGVVFAHINSHTGRGGFLYEGNEIADRLAGGSA